MISLILAAVFAVTSIPSNSPSLPLCKAAYATRNWDETAAICGQAIDNIANTVPDDQQQSQPDAWTSATWKAVGDMIEVTMYEGIAEVSKAEATNNNDLYDT